MQLASIIGIDFHGLLQNVMPMTPTKSPFSMRFKDMVIRYMNKALQALVEHRILEVYQGTPGVASLHSYHLHLVLPPQPLELHLLHDLLPWLRPVCSVVHSRWRCNLAGVQCLSSAEASGHTTDQQGALVSITGDANIRTGIWPSRHYHYEGQMPAPTNSTGTRAGIWPSFAHRVHVVIAPGSGERRAVCPEQVLRSINGRADRAVCHCPCHHSVRQVRGRHGFDGAPVARCVDILDDTAM